MGILSLILGPLSGLLDTVLKRVLPGEKMPEADREKLKNEIMLGLMQADVSMLEAQVKVLVTELSGNWLQRSWRPILMLSIVAVVVNNYILFPYVNLFFPGKALILILPDYLWNLMEIGVGGYVVGRSAEKIAENFKK